MITRLKLLTPMLCTMLLFASAVSWSASDSPQALDEARKSALDRIEAGKRLEAVLDLLAALRGIPPDRPDLAAPALGLVQLLLFTNEYLMTNEECRDLYAGRLDEKNQPMDRFLVTLMRMTDDTGLQQKEVDECGRNLFELSWGEHKAVRMGALFIMSDPYYYWDTEVGHRARERFITEFPGEYLAQEAQRLPLYMKRKDGVAGFRDVLDRKDSEGKLRPLGERLRRDPVGRAVHESTSAVAPGESAPACVARLRQLAAGSGSWAERYAALNLIEGFHETEQAPIVRKAAEETLLNCEDPRVRFRARLIRMSIARNQGDAAAIIEDAQALLDTKDIPAVPDRNMYEELKNSIQQSSDKLAELGQSAKALQLLERLAARFPNTLLATQLQEKLGPLRAMAQAQTLSQR